MGANTRAWGRCLKSVRLTAIAFLVLVFAAGLLAHVLSPAGYAHQFRDVLEAASSRQHPLGTDDLGRDRLARLLYGTRVSLLLAPAAALLSSVLAALIGGTAGLAGGWVERSVTAATDLFLSLPWLFLLITVRALLPLNIDPCASAVATFALLGCLGWAGAARVICADARTLRESDFILLARASGSSGPRILFRHMIPNLKPVLSAQFWTSIPVFILAEANLGILGLAVAEPLPSWGGLLRELEGFSVLNAEPLKFVPLVLLVATMICFRFAMPKEDVSL
jgi:ABC-type dipeptide/oligopeptide/nickel transport system permease subunit